MTAEREDRTGHFYEALLSHALDTMPASPVLHEAHKALPHIGIDSDIIIPSVAKPTTVILVTHSQAESGTNMKFWRNIGEMLAIRQHFPNVRIVNVIFPSQWKQGMLPLLESAADMQIDLNGNIESEISTLTASAMAERKQSFDEYKTFLATTTNASVTKVLSALHNLLSKALHAPVSTEWQRYASIPAASTQIEYSCDTSFKKGLCRLSLLRDDDRQNITANATQLNKLAVDVLTRASEAGVVEICKGIVTRYTLERACLYAIEKLGHDALGRIFCLAESFHCSAKDELLRPLYGRDGLTLASYITNLVSHVTQADLQHAIVDSLIEWNKRYPSERNLPLAYLYIAGKALDSRVSHRRLSELCGLPMIGGLSPIPQFLYGKGGLPKSALRKIGSFFAELFLRRGFPSGENLQKKMMEETEDKLMKHRYFNLLLYACIDRCQQAKYAVSNIGNPSVELANGLADYARDVRGHVIHNNVAATHFSFEATSDTGSVLFLVVSAYDSTHKHKEYPARWRCAQIVHGSDGFHWRSDFTRCVVVLDGQWRELYGDLDDALRAYELPGIKLVCDAETFFQMDLKALVS
jgi:hypothetical protein